MEPKDILHFDYLLSPESPFRLVHVRVRASTGSTREIDVHHAAHLGILLEGEVEFWINGEQGTVHPGQVWLTAPMEPHGTVRRSADYDFVLVSFRWEEIDRIFGEKFPGRNRLLYASPALRMESINRNISGRVPALGRELAGLRNCNDDYGQMRQWLLFLAVLTEIFRCAGDLDDPSGSFLHYERIRPALELLKQRRDSGIVSLADAAAACSLSAGRFNHLFKQYYHMAFGKFEMKCRLNSAAAAIRQGNLTLTDIALRWGFTDNSHFGRCFRKAYGCSPGTFRKRLEGPG